MENFYTQLMEPMEFHYEFVRWGKGHRLRAVEELNRQKEDIQGYPPRPALILQQLFSLFERVKPGLSSNHRRAEPWGVWQPAQPDYTAAVGFSQVRAALIHRVQETHHPRAASHTAGMRSRTGRRKEILPCTGHTALQGHHVHTSDIYYKINKDERSKRFIVVI